MSKFEKEMGVPTPAERRRDPVVEPHRTPGKPGPKKRKPYLLLTTFPGWWKDRPPYVRTERFVSSAARAQARARYERQMKDERHFYSKPLKIEERDE